MWQQRVFIGDMQRFSIMEMGPSMMAREVLEGLAKQGQFEGIQGVGGWMLFEVAQDFGMGEFPDTLLGSSGGLLTVGYRGFLCVLERPIRAYEVVADVVNSWDKDRTVNTLIAKLSELAYLLRPSVSVVCLRSYGRAMTNEYYLRCFLGHAYFFTEICRLC